MSEAPRKIQTLGCEVDALTLAAAVQLVLGWLEDLERRNPADGPAPCRYVVTPNLDHAVQLKTDLLLQASYRDASLVLADGMPLVWAARLWGRPLPERVAGSDFVPALLGESKPGTKVFLLGASEESSLKAATTLDQDFPNVQVVGRLSPPFGFEHSEEWSTTITTTIQESDATLIIVGFGAPKQELWVHAHQNRLPGTVLLCAGATIDFLAGSVNRSPIWAQKLGVEWVHRLLSDPRRLVGRYTKDVLALPGLLLADARTNKNAKN